ncbi:MULTISPECIES: MarR family transcriptional regulator [Oceanobacillus]|uniref:MarR family transcriptional regulator n=1 Tax=Oceanobacillus TaxID=182709 RepID=UPI0005963BD7|nr:MULTISPECIES: MarR family transcriptional regulator [Oceanobacillus]
MDESIKKQKFDNDLSDINELERRANAHGFSLYKINQKNKAVFTQTINENLEILIKSNHLTNAEYTLLFLLMPFVELHSNAIVNSDGQFMSVSELAATLKRERTRLSKTISQLLEKGILFEFVNAQELKKYKRNISQRPFFINPEIIFRGDRNRVNATLTRLVMEFDVLESQGIKLSWKLYLKSAEEYGKLYKRNTYLKMRNKM